jgi:transmembrane sensor
MPPSVHRYISSEVIDEASAWFVLLRAASISANDRESFTHWLRRSQDHVSAYLSIAEIWADAAHVAQGLDLDLPAEIPANITPFCSLFVPVEVHPKVSVASASARQRLLGKWPLRIAASVLLVCAISTGVWFSYFASATYSTGIGERRSITLRDGSVMQMDARSTVVARFTRTSRKVQLIAGQALFQVVHDRSRPFVVESRGTAIRAVGTEFDVNRLQNGTIVSVLNGKIVLNAVPQSWYTRFIPAKSLGPSETADGPDLVSGPTTPNAQRLAEPTGPAYALSAGERGSIDSRGYASRRAITNTAASTGWLDSELLFQDEPLSTIVEQFNRYSQVPIVLSGPKLGNLGVTAVFHSTNSESLLLFIGRLEGVAIERTSDRITVRLK